MTQQYVKLRHIQCLQADIPIWQHQKWNMDHRCKQGTIIFSKIESYIKSKNTNMLSAATSFTYPQALNRSVSLPIFISPFLDCSDSPVSVSNKIEAFFFMINNQHF